MKTRALLVITISLLILALFLYAFSRRSIESLPVVPATINRDCAPWDGSAFTVSIPLEGSAISISIYQSPDITRPIRFSFPDETLQVGSALLISPIGSPEQLRGDVSFQNVRQGVQVEGEFDLASEASKRFKGKFVANWGNEIIYCG